jgi:hypothetical protein
MQVESGPLLQLQRTDGLSGEDQSSRRNDLPLQPLWGEVWQEVKSPAAFAEARDGLVPVPIPAEVN